jgi:hypothetical protein
MKLLLPRILSAVAVATLVAGAMNAAAIAQSVSVTLNGTPMALSPAPQTRAGRVFVPLRGIFENLGASVVYADGTINAQGHGRSVSLHIGSTQATVNGQPQTLDVAPFIIGASTFVPLRFVSQALGADVNYDGANRIVAIASGGGPGPRTIPAQTIPAQVSVSGLRLSDVQPARDAAVPERRPTIGAQFANGRVRPDSLRITVDGNDVTPQTTRSPGGFTYTPQSPLEPIEHTVHVIGMTTDGAQFNQSWRFTTGDTRR